MAEATADKKLIVSDVVSALTGIVAPTEEPGDLREQMERAAADFDRRTAAAFGKALLDSLTEDPGNLRQLEALLILGLAHPDVLKKNRISLAVEGRRLSILLERAGEVDRARGVLELLSTRMPDERTIDHELAGLLRRSGNTDELVARYLSRAEAFIAAGKVGEAIPWLQEILLLDRTRRDVARMIRDLRYDEAEKEVRSGRRNRLLASLVLAASLVTAVVYREIQTQAEFDRIPEAVMSSRDLVTARFEAIEDFVSRERFWHGIFSAKAEVVKLQARLTEMEEARVMKAQAEEIERQRTRDTAEMTRTLGIQQVERGEYHDALNSFRRCLELDVPNWEHRARVEADIAALVEHLDGNR